MLTSSQTVSLISLILQGHSNQHTVNFYYWSPSIWISDHLQGQILVCYDYPVQVLFCLLNSFVLWYLLPLFFSFLWKSCCMHAQLFFFHLMMILGNFSFLSHKKILSTYCTSYDLTKPLGLSYPIEPSNLAYPTRNTKWLKKNWAQMSFVLF